MPKYVGRITYESHYVIIQVPDEWTTHDELPPAHPTDRWFPNRQEFETALGVPYDREPINRRPLSA